MILKGIIDEDFINYKKPTMTLLFPKCTFKCDKECGQQVCQNSTLATAPEVIIPTEKLIDRYLSNPITEAVCFQGLEPMDSWDEVLKFITLFRIKCSDDIVIYTGYTEDELYHQIYLLKNTFTNIIIKFGRYIPEQKEHYDEVLGVKLASDNQYAVRY